MPQDRFKLQRFIDAQAAVFDQVISELTAGRKRSHWMWFIFPQLAALGHSPTAKHYGISSLAEAQAYLDHPVLGQRLHDCTRLAINAPASSLNALFGAPDDLKFRSSMTLFDVAGDGHNPLFQEALDKWCAGQADETTLNVLAKS